MVGGRTANQSLPLRPIGTSTSAQLNFSGTSNDAESLGDSVTASAARSAVDHAHSQAKRVNWGQQIGGIEATRSPLIEVSAGAASLPAPSSRFKGLRLVAATADTLQTSIVHTIGERLSATPIAAMFGFGHDNATRSDNSPAPSGGSGGKTPPPASPTAVLTTPLALAIAAPRVTYAQISTVLAAITLSIYVPPG
jgi:hypothetical protein